MLLVPVVSVKVAEMTRLAEKQSDRVESGKMERERGREREESGKKEAKTQCKKSLLFFCLIRIYKRASQVKMDRCREKEERVRSTTWSLVKLRHTQKRGGRG